MKIYLDITRVFLTKKHQTKNNLKTDCLKCHSPSIAKISRKISLVNYFVYKSMSILQVSYSAIIPSESFIATKVPQL